MYAEINKIEAPVAKATEDTTDLTQAMAELDRAVAKGTKLRQEEKSKNIDVISYAGGANITVALTLTVLQPETFDEPYKGMGGEGGCAVGVLDVVELDFARRKAVSKAGEASTQEEYDKFMIGSDVDKAKDSTDKEHKPATKQG